MADSRVFMEQALELSRRCVPEGNQPRASVGAVLVNAAGEVVLTGYRNERNDGGHAEYVLLDKAEQAGLVLRDHALYVTLEPCTVRNLGKTPCALRLIESGVGSVCIGMLDPNPDIVGRGEMMLRYRGIRVERFPDDLIREIRSLNEPWAKQFDHEHMPPDSVYLTKQIPEIVRHRLAEALGRPIPELPLAGTISDIAEALSLAAAERVHLSEARGFAYDEKYETYTYDKDARGVVSDWHEDLFALLARLGRDDLSEADLLVVGIGNGLEADVLSRKGVPRLTAVDAAPRSLKRAAGLLPVGSSCLIADAETLDGVDSGSQDVYLSLRTYQSTFFDRAAAVRAARRVLRPGGITVVSVANAFRSRAGDLLPGLFIPGTKYRDEELPYELALEVRSLMSAVGFRELTLLTGRTEIFVGGRVVPTS